MAYHCGSGKFCLSRRKTTKAQRQLLRPWLEEQIDRARFPGLHWLPGNRHRMFRIPWKHLGKPGWREEDCLIFKAWAKHTGRYIEGRDPPDWSGWKLRLRNAFNRAWDINEVDELSQTEGSEPFKVYRLEPRRRTNSLPDDLQDIRCEDLLQGNLCLDFIQTFDELNEDSLEQAEPTWRNNPENGFFSV